MHKPSLQHSAESPVDAETFTSFYGFRRREDGEDTRPNKIRRVTINEFVVNHHGSGDVAR